VRHADLPPVNAGDRLDLGLMAAKDLLQRQRYFADRRLRARGIDGKRKQIAVAAGGVARERGQRLGDGLRIALALEAAELVDLQLAHRAVVYLEDFDRRFVPRPVLVHPDDRLRAGIDTRLRAGRGLFDAQLG